MQPGYPTGALPQGLIRPDGKEARSSTGSTLPLACPLVRPAKGVRWRLAPLRAVRSMPKGYSVETFVRLLADGARHIVNVA